jgi:hypothetical protein
VELVQFDLVKKESWRIWLLGYLGRGHSALLGSFERCFGRALIYFESGTISPREGVQSWSGSTHGKGPSFILQLGIYSILFLDSRSTLLEYFACYRCQGGRGPNSWVFIHPRGCKPIRGLFISMVITSSFNPRLH